MDFTVSGKSGIKKLEMIYELLCLSHYLENFLNFNMSIKIFPKTFQSYHAFSKEKKNIPCSVKYPWHSMLFAV